MVTIVAGLVAAGTLLSVWGFQLSRDADARRIEAEFDRRAENRHALTRQIIAYYQSGLYALKSLFEGSDRVSHEEFREIAVDILARHPGITALEWVPLVPAGQRAAVEAEINAELGRAFTFTERGRDGMVRAGNRPEYGPIVYVEPLQGNEAALGLDVLTAASRPYVETARRTRAFTTTPQFELAQGGLGVVMIWPVFTRVPGDQTERVCRGFVQGVFRVDRMLQQSLSQVPSVALDELYLDGSEAAGANRMLYARWGDLAGAGAVPLTEDGMRSGEHREFPLPLGGRKWIALYRPTSSWVAAEQSVYPYVWLAVGLGITGLLAALVASLARRTAAVQREVDLRTAELNESRRQLANLLHALPGIAFRCRVGTRLDEALFISEGTQTLAGYAPEEVTSGQVHLLDLVHPDDLVRVKSILQTGLNEQREVEAEFRIRSRSGEQKWLLARARGVYTETGDLRFYDGLAVDVTARRDAEAEKVAMERRLLHSQKLESLGLLAGGIAHDFNNILTGIMGNASLARCAPAVGPEATEHLKKIEEGATRAAELCQQMLAFSGRGRFVTETVDLNRIVRDTLPLLQGSLPTRARLELDLSAAPVFVTGDATQLRQIAMNLILNAGEALPVQGGEVTVGSGFCQVDATFLAEARVGEALAPGEYAYLEVRDTGSGMTPETLGKIFDPFFTTKFTGRGLGLAAVLGIVRGHSGGLRVRSQPGRGSTFTLVLPRSTDAARTNDAVATAAPWSRTGRVLVIDDEAAVREIAARLLRTFGFTVVTAADGAEGLRVFRNGPSAFDFVFLDLTMPGLDGVETLAALRAVAPQVRVLLVSGYSESERVTQLAAGGPLIFLQKPFSRSKLEQKLRELLD